MTATTLTVLTWNLYLGADITRVINASPQELPACMSALWEMVQANDFRQRGDAIAQAIANLDPASQPDVIVLQEAFRWSIISPLSSPGPDAATLMVYDYGQFLLGALAGRGLHYAPGAVSPGMSVTLPTAQGKSIRFEDSVMVLVREGGPRRLRRSNPQHGTYGSSLKVWVGDTPLPIHRPWAAVDVTVEGIGTFVRVVGTHLESFYPPVRQSQVTELLEGPCATKEAVILAGDFNGPAPSDNVYETLLANGFQDAWAAAGLDLGYTWGQDEDLRNPSSKVTERMDWILVRGLRPMSARLMGDQPQHLDDGRLWLSDHAAVLAQVRI